MFSRILTRKSTESCSEKIERLRAAAAGAEALVIGAGAGLSAAAGLTYSGERFQRNLGDFIEKYGIRDMYSGGFYPFQTPEEYWAWWSRHIMINRYERAPGPAYDRLLELVSGREYFVLTTNVDHQFQMAGFDKKRLFYTQGDYGLWQCSKPCHRETYDNENTVRRMAAEQREMKVPSKLIPSCPKCGKPMTMNLRADGKFVQDEGWYEAAERYKNFLRKHGRGRLLYLELGVGWNTPAIIKYPFWKYTHENPDAVYACINLERAAEPVEIAERSVCISADIGGVIDKLLEEE